MSIIIAIKGAIKGEFGVCMGADSLYRSGIYKYMSTHPGKIIQLDNLLIGVAGATRYTKYIHKAPHYAAVNLAEYADNVFVPWFKGVCKSEDLLQSDTEYPSVDCELLLATKSEIVRMEPDFTILESVYSYDAIGTGENVAKGAISLYQDVLDLELTLVELMDAVFPIVYKHVVDCGGKPVYKSLC